MAVYKITNDNRVILLRFNSHEEEYNFYENNKLLGYKLIDDKDLPEFRYVDCLRYDSKQDKIIIDVNCEIEKLKKELIAEINRRADNYIFQKLKSLDWGQTYSECLSELNNSVTSTETELLVIMKKYKPDFTITELREKVALYLVGKLTNEDVISELNQLKVSDSDKKTILEVLKEASTVARLLYWKDNIVWKYVEQKEKEIENTNDIESLKLVTRTEKETNPNIKGIVFDLDKDCPLEI